MKSLLDETEEKSDDEPSQTPSNRKPKDSFTFRDIQNAKHIYSVPADQSTSSRIKRKLDDYLHHYTSPSTSTTADNDNDTFKGNMEEPQAKIVNVTDNKEVDAPSTNIINHLKETASKDNHQISQDTVRENTDYDNVKTLGKNQSMPEHENASIRHHQTINPHHIDRPTKEPLHSQKKRDMNEKDNQIVEQSAKSRHIEDQNTSDKQMDSQKKRGV